MADFTRLKLALTRLVAVTKNSQEVPFMVPFDQEHKHLSPIGEIWDKFKTDHTHCRSLLFNLAFVIHLTKKKRANNKIMTTKLVHNIIFSI